MLLRYSSFLGLDLSSDTEISLANEADAASWAADAVKTLADAGLITDSDGGAFAPEQPASRAQVAAVLARFMDQYE